MEQYDDFEDLFKLVNEHAELAKAAREAEEEAQRLSDEEKRRYAKLIQDAHNESLRRREEEIQEKKIKRKIIIKASIVAAIITVLCYAILTMDRATEIVNERFGGTYHYMGSSAGYEVTFEGSEPTWSDYTDQFWDCIGDDLNSVKDFFIGRGQ